MITMQVFVSLAFCQMSVLKVLLCKLPFLKKTIVNLPVADVYWTPVCKVSLFPTPWYEVCRS